MKRVIGTTAILILVFSTYITLSNSWIVPKINKWQMTQMGENSYYPALTIFIIAIPPLLVLFLISKLTDKKV